MESRRSPQLRGLLQKLEGNDSDVVGEAHAVDNQDTFERQDSPVLTVEKDGKQMELQVGELKVGDRAWTQFVLNVKEPDKEHGDVTQEYHWEICIPSGQVEPFLRFIRKEGPLSGTVVLRDLRNPSIAYILKGGVNESVGRDPKKKPASDAGEAQGQEEALVYRFRKDSEQEEEHWGQIASAHRLGQLREILNEMYGEKYPADMLGNIVAVVFKMQNSLADLGLRMEEAFGSFAVVLREKEEDVLQAVRAVESN